MHLATGTRWSLAVAGLMTAIAVSLTACNPLTPSCNSTYHGQTVKCPPHQGGPVQSVVLAGSSWT